MASETRRDERMDPRAGGSEAGAVAVAFQPSAQSYHETRWPLVNQALAITEQLTGGRAGTVQRLFTYVMIGGTAAVVNLGAFAIFEHFGSLKVFSIYSAFAYVTAYEVSILANFIPNDYFTFRFLPGHQRSWLARCLRFHTTSSERCASDDGAFMDLLPSAESATAGFPGPCADPGRLLQLYCPSSLYLRRQALGRAPRR